MHSVFVVSGVTIYREGIIAFLALQPELQVTGAASHLDSSIGEHDLCVLDVTGLDRSAVDTFVSVVPQSGTPVVVMGLPGTEQQVLAYLEAGASGYVTKEDSLDELHHVISCTLSNGACVRDCDLAAVLGRFRNSGGSSRPTQMSLTNRERQVARLLAKSRSNREIARELDISVHTVKHHVRRTLLKLGLERRAEATALRGRLDILVE